MKLLENITLWASVALYAAGLVAIIVGLAVRREKLGAAGLRLSMAAVIVQALAIITRWINVDHVPVTDTYENSLVGTWFIVVLFLLLYRRRGRAVVATIVIGVCLLILGHGIVSGTDPRSYTQQFRGVWLPVHVVFALLAFGSYTLATGLAGFFLLKGRKGMEKENGGWMGKLPETGVLEDLAFRYVLLGFVAHIIMIGSGAIWAQGLWGRYWGWDPVETWSLISWVIYGIVIHLKLTLGWKGRRLAWLTLFSFLGVLVAYGGIGFVTSLHVGIF